jgi:hypothetical protein
VSEYPLRGGSVSTVVRAGDTVRRQPGRPFVRELLGFLERSGWGGAPRFLGVDEQGREILTFVDGYVPWQEGEAAGVSGVSGVSGVTVGASLVRVAELVRGFHDLTAGTPLAGTPRWCVTTTWPRTTPFTPLMALACGRWRSSTGTWLHRGGASTTSRTCAGST